MASQLPSQGHYGAAPGANHSEGEPLLILQEAEGKSRRKGGENARGRGGNGEGGGRGSGPEQRRLAQGQHSSAFLAVGDCATSDTARTRPRVEETASREAVGALVPGPLPERGGAAHPLPPSQKGALQPPPQDAASMCSTDSCLCCPSSSSSSSVRRQRGPGQEGQALGPGPVLARAPLSSGSSSTPSPCLCRCCWRCPPLCFHPLPTAQEDSRICCPPPEHQRGGAPPPHPSSAPHQRRCPAYSHSKHPLPDPAPCGYHAASCWQLVAQKSVQRPAEGWAALDDGQGGSEGVSPGLGSERSAGQEGWGRPAGVPPPGFEQRDVPRAHSKVPLGAEVPAGMCAWQNMLVCTREEEEDGGGGEGERAAVPKEQEGDEPQQMLHSASSLAASCAPPYKSCAKRPRQPQASQCCLKAKACAAAEGSQRWKRTQCGGALPSAPDAPGTASHCVPSPKTTAPGSSKPAAAAPAGATPLDWALEPELPAREPLQPSSCSLEPEPAAYLCPGAAHPSYGQGPTYTPLSAAPLLCSTEEEEEYARWEMPSCDDTGRRALPGEPGLGLKRRSSSRGDPNVELSQGEQEQLWVQQQQLLPWRQQRQKLCQEDQQQWHQQQQQQQALSQDRQQPQLQESRREGGKPDSIPQPMTRCSWGRLSHSSKEKGGPEQRAEEDMGSAAKDGSKDLVSGVDEQGEEEKSQKRAVEGEVHVAKEVVSQTSWALEEEEEDRAAEANVGTENSKRETDCQGMQDGTEGPADHGLTSTWLQGASQYSPYILMHLRLAEQRRPPCGLYFSRCQPLLTPQMRSILIDWLAEVSAEFGLCDDTLHLSCSLLDRFLASPTAGAVPRGRLQLVGVTALFIAAKYEEVRPPLAEEFCFITDNTYSKQEVLAMEATILRTVRFELGTTTAVGFLSLFFQPLEASLKAREVTKLLALCSFLVDLSLVEYECLTFPPSTVAAAAMGLARRILHPEDQHPLPHYCKSLSSSEMQEVKACVAILYKLLQGAISAPRTSSAEGGHPPATSTPPSVVPPLPQSCIAVTPTENSEQKGQERTPSVGSAPKHDAIQEKHRGLASELGSLLLQPLIPRFLDALVP